MALVEFGIYERKSDQPVTQFHHLCITPTKPALLGDFRGITRHTISLRATPLSNYTSPIVTLLHRSKLSKPSLPVVSTVIPYVTATMLLDVC